MKRRRGRRAATGRTRASVTALTAIFRRPERGGLNFRRRRHTLERTNWRGLAFLVVQLVAVVLFAYGLVDAFGIKATMVGSSMEPTIADGDVVLINRLSTRLFTPDAGDIILFAPGGSEDATPAIKRIVGVPQDAIHIESGAIYVNGQMYVSTTHYDYISDPGLAEGTITLGEDEFFVLGDNVDSSQDSRHVSIGNVRRSDMRGQVWWNLSHAGLVY